MSESDHEQDFALAIDHAEHMQDVALARLRLEKLAVAQLRVLHRHYFEQPRIARELNKKCLIDDLIEPIMEDGR